MSEATGSRVKFKTKLNFEVGNAKSSKRRSEEETNSVPERGKFKRSSRLSSRDEIEGKRGCGAENSDLKRKRVYAERGVDREGDYKNGGVPSRRSFSGKGGFDKDKSFRRKSSTNDDISDFDRMNRMKFSSSRGSSTRNDDFSEDKIRNKEAGSWRDYYTKRAGKGDSKRSFGREKERVGSEEAFDGTFKSKVKTRDRWITSSKREEEERSDNKLNSQSKSRERWPSTKRDEMFDAMSKTKGKIRDRGGASTKQGKDEESDSKFKSQTKTRDTRTSTKRDGVSDSKFNTKAKTSNRLTKQDDAGDGSQNQQSKNNTGSNREVDQNASNRREVGPLEISTKKMLLPKKYTEENPLSDGRRKRKKRKLMGIHPYDISTKRLDDGISIDGNNAEEKVDPDKDVEISTNAKFRAVQPTPSILSFVEDNLLGRRREIDLRRAGYNIDFSAPLDNIPFSTSTERERIEEAVFRNRLEFLAAAKVSSSFPPPELPEIAFAGRSNVGKSSLLNALTRQWGVVRTSDKPGLTQTINFFKLGTKLSMVDLPGYGFAYAKEEVKDAWEELVKEYVSTRVGLKRVCLLVDTKWGMKPRDHELISLMERSQTKYQIVLTKSDTVFPIDVARRAMQIEQTLSANKSLVQPVMMVSSKSGGGVRCLRTVLAKVARFAKL